MGRITQRSPLGEVVGRIVRKRSYNGAGRGVRVYPVGWFRSKEYVPPYRVRYFFWGLDRGQFKKREFTRCGEGWEEIWDVCKKGRKKKRGQIHFTSSVVDGVV